MLAAPTTSATANPERIHVRCAFIMSRPYHWITIISIAGKTIKTPLSYSESQPRNPARMRLRATTHQCSQRTQARARTGSTVVHPPYFCGHRIPSRHHESRYGTDGFGVENAVHSSQGARRGPATCATTLRLTASWLEQPVQRMPEDKPHDSKSAPFPRMDAGGHGNLSANHLVHRRTNRCTIPFHMSSTVTVMSAAACSNIQRRIKLSL